MRDAAADRIRDGMHRPAELSELGDQASVLPLRLPDLPPGLSYSRAAHRSEETDDEHAARARIPSWDDILMGVRRKRD